MKSDYKFFKLALSIFLTVTLIGGCGTGQRVPRKPPPDTPQEKAGPEITDHRDFPTTPPPPPVAESPGTNPGYIFVPGHYRWEQGKGYYWHGGHWTRARADKKIWRSGQWVKSGPRYVFVEGEWVSP